MTPAGRPWQGAQPVHGSADTSYRRIGVVYGRWGALIRPGIRPRSGLKRSPAASPGFPLPLGPLGEGLKFGNFDDFSQCCSSRGAALECSPGRKPGVLVSTGGQPRRGERFRADSFAPSGAGFATERTPGSRPGYVLTPLRGKKPKTHVSMRANLRNEMCVIGTAAEVRAPFQSQPARSSSARPLA